MGLDSRKNMTANFFEANCRFSFFFLNFFFVISLTIINRSEKKRKKKFFYDKSCQGTQKPRLYSGNFSEAFSSWYFYEGSFSLQFWKLFRWKGFAEENTRKRKRESRNLPSMRNLIENHECVERVPSSLKHFYGSYLTRTKVLTPNRKYLYVSPVP